MICEAATLENELSGKEISTKLPLSLKKHQTPSCSHILQLTLGSQGQNWHEVIPSNPWLYHFLVRDEKTEAHRGPGVPNLRDLMPDDLGWSWCNDVTNKMHNKYNVLESYQNHPPTPWSMEKLSCTKLDPGAKKVGDHSLVSNLSSQCSVNGEIQSWCCK